MENLVYVPISQLSCKELRCNFNSFASLTLISTENTAPKTNKRFLSSVIKSTDEHNKTLLRAQALAAAEAKAKKDEQESLQRKLNAQEATESHRSRHKHHRRRGSERDSSKHMRHKRKERSWDREGKYDSPRIDSARHYSSGSASGDEDRSQRKNSNLSPSDREGRSQRRRHHSTEEKDKKRIDRRHSHRYHEEKEETHRKRNEYDLSEEESEESRWRRRRRAEKSRLLLRDSLSPGPTYIPTALATEAGLHSKSTSPNPTQKPSQPTRDRSGSPNPKARKSKFKPIDRPRSPTPAIDLESSSTLLEASRDRTPSPVPNFSSKMDRYFTDTYDPRLDTAALNKKPKVPKEGLIPDEEFEGWDAMLEVIQLRRKDKEEKKRLEILYGVESTKKKKKKKGDKLQLSWETVEKKRQALSERVPDIMDIRYQSKGGVREWDMGKVDIELL